jgi:hypothetical protein
MSVRFAAMAFLITSLMAADTIAVSDCTIIDPRSGTSTPHSTIVINGERIAATGRGIRSPKGHSRHSRIIRATGKFVIPGLWDMHVHVGEIEEDWFPLYLANGITGLREMAASQKNAPRQQRYEEDVRIGRRVGPELFWTLSALDGPEIRDERQARAEVARRAAMGLSYIKVYNGLSREVYFAIADECRKRGLQMVGHVPDRISALEAARAGQASVEHLDGILLACSANEAVERWFVQQGRCRWNILLDTFDSAKADALINSFRTAGVWQTPTLVIYRIASLALNHQLPGEVPVQYARRDYLSAWPREAKMQFAPDAQSARRLLAAYKDLVRRMDQRGVRILAGTDTPYPYCMPGFALHDELELLVEAGLSPAAALRAATSNPAEFMRADRDYGSVEPGKVADLVILNADPLQAISNTRRIHAVVRRGHLIDAAELKSMLDSVRANVARRSIPAQR